MENILVSACLLGYPCRYDGKASLNNKIQELGNYYNLIPICPEQLGGLKTPREPNEILNGKVCTKDGYDNTKYFIDGANKTLEIAKQYNCKMAILKSKSPSCAKKQIYDGTFSKTLILGEGFTCKLLRENNIKIYDENESLLISNKI